MVMTTNLQQLYAIRFGDTGLAKRDRVWRVLCEDFFNALVEPGGVVLDLACGYGEFIRKGLCLCFR
jgi:ubiquinone/menaquinone biosynthesis C-methylase UbiE